MFLLPWDPCLVCAHPFPLGVPWKGQWDRRLQNQSGTALSWCLFNDPPSCLSLFFYAATEWLATRVALKSSKERLQLSDLPARLSAERGAPAAAQPCLAEVGARFPGPCFLQPLHCASKPLPVLRGHHSVGATSLPLSLFLGHFRTLSCSGSDSCHDRCPGGWCRRSFGDWLQGLFPGSVP